MRQEFPHLMPDFLFEYEKGGGNGMMMMMMSQMMQEKETQRTLAEQAAKKLDKDTKIAETKAADKFTTDLASSNTKVQSSYDAAIASAKQDLINKGYTGDALNNALNQFVQKMDATKASLGTDKIIENPAASFTTAPLDAILSDLNTNFHNQTNKQLNEFAGEGFANKLITDTADDSFINAILDEQYGKAKSALDVSKARGFMNDLGYSSGLLELDKQRTKGFNDANLKGMDVLNKGRTSLNDIATSAFNKVGKTQYGDPFDVGGVKSNIDTTFNTFSSSLEDQIKAAIGGDSWFNTDKAVGVGGTSSGVMNVPTPTNGLANPLAVPVAPANRILTPEDDENRRTQGVF